MRNYARLPVKNAYNVRELGGYPCADGSATEYHRFLRADDLSQLDAADIYLLLKYGLSAVVDLRSASELAQNPDPFSKIAEVNYINIPLMADDVADVTRVMVQRPSTYLREAYIEMLIGSTGAVKRIFDFIAEQSGCVLFHCAAGKDRTGVLAMLLLGLSEVGKGDIIANYEVTGTYISENPAMKQAGQQYPSELMESRREYIEPAIDYIVSAYGSVENYLSNAGVSAGTLEKVKSKLL
ncbi:MAG: tyrosine-protein phosphatase [Oscillospiraceae bacterium]|jgi:protein-tyrosine phosphatase|nr:tyrosine-protein phosphatase [Oscillospiraceae bacterium]